MLDHFSILAPVYEWMVPPPEPSILYDMAGLTPESVLLDAAGGTGRVSALYSSRVRRVVLCDTARGMLDKAAGKGLEVIEAPVERLPFADSEFDAILLVDAFHHLEDQKAALKELLRVLKPAGRLIIEEPDIRRFSVKIAAFLEKIFLMRSNFVPLGTMVEWVGLAGGKARLTREDHFRIWLSVCKS